MREMIGGVSARKLAALGIIEAVWQPESPVEADTLKATKSVKGPDSVNKSSSTNVMDSMDGMNGMGLDGRKGVISVKGMDVWTSIDSHHVSYIWTARILTLFMLLDIYRWKSFEKMIQEIM